VTDLYAITPEERATYTAFSTTMWRQLVRPLPETLWYYTNASTFERILKTGEVWSTQISCLNDHSEFRYAVRRLRDEIKNYVGHGDEHIRFLAQHLYETLEQDGADTSWFFVFCMSSVADDLSQWRAYGGGEGGVAIGFNPLKLVQGEISTRGYLVPVRYSEQDHKAIVSDVAIGTLKFFREGLEHRKDSDRKVWAERFLEAWRDHVVYCAPILKDGSFESEHEWRLVVNLRPEDVARVEIQQRSALISRHLPLSFGETLPIQHVIVGPCRHPSVSRVSIGTYLRAQGYGLNEPNEHDAKKVTLTSSKIPYQAM
jgi:Protein of unknown function (DUF2971)